MSEALSEQKWLAAVMSAPDLLGRSSEKGKTPTSQGFRCHLRSPRLNRLGLRLACLLTLTREVREENEKYLCSSRTQ